MNAAVPPWIAGQARQLLAQRGHAWLLHGPSGLGQYELALALARAWLCDEPAADGACGRCQSCHAIEVHAHTDLFVLMPETVMLELGWPLDEKAQADIDDKKRKPSKDIRIESVRDSVEFSQRTSGRGRGKVVLVSSVRGRHGTARGYSAYCASKSAVDGITRSLACEWGPHKINVNAIGPTVFRSKLTEWMFQDDSKGSASRVQSLPRIPLGRLGEPDDLTGIIVYLMAPASDFCTGQIIYVDGGYTAA